jgi:DNA-binding transcriptional MerR regulator
MSSRTYLSIGDVLTLLRQEFPDVTISKIRFLESQGLVNPERSPSGYRKFYDHDVERLRWVLRQQREHFLPLKVIRDRLARTGDIPADDAEFDEIADDVALDEAQIAVVDELEEQLEDQEDAESEAALQERVAVLNGAAPHRVPEPFADPVAPVEDTELVVIVGAASRTYEAEVSAERLEAHTETRAGVLVTTSSPLAPRVTAVKTAPVSRSDVDNPQHEQPPTRAATAAPEPRPVASTAPVVEPVDTEPTGPRAPRVPARESASIAPGLSANITGASLTLDELCAASGLTATEVASLEGFGLIEPLVVGGVLYYDEEGLTVAKLVADFARFGIEPRHLRLFRNAVDRELGLIEQVLTPLLRQRNPEARQRAVEAAGELSRLGQSLRASILRRALRHHFGG